MISKNILLSGAALLLSLPMSMALNVSQTLAADLPISTLPVIEKQVEIWNPWTVRLRAIAVTPDESARLKLDGERIAGDVHASVSIVPEVDISYFFTKNIAAELILGTSRHKVKAAEEVKDLGRIGQTWILPPTLTVQYHFNPDGIFKPYVGAGVNYTFFYSEKAKGDFDKFELDDKFGFALQAGVDLMIDKHWAFNVDVKKIFLKTDVDALHNSGANVTGKVKLDPWIIGSGVAYRF